MVSLNKIYYTTFNSKDTLFLIKYIHIYVLLKISYPKICVLTYSTPIPNLMSKLLGISKKNYL